MVFALEFQNDTRFSWNDDIRRPWAQSLRALFGECSMIALALAAMMQHQATESIRPSPTDLLHRGDLLCKLRRAVAAERRIPNDLDIWREFHLLSSISSTIAAIAAASSSST